jgi:hypothetical protein
MEILVILQTPSSVAEWQEVIDGFRIQWNFPNCIGAVDGKHVRVVCPRRSGSYYFNYKDYYSVVLMAVVNHRYEFIYVDTGAEGKASDGGIWRQCSFFHALNRDDNPLNIPAPTLLPGQTEPTPNVLLADDAFALSSNLMKPFPGTNLIRRDRIFNYRLSRGRRIVENTFGIMTTKFRIFHQPIAFQPLRADKVIMAAVCLHNFLRRKCGNSYFVPNEVDHENASHDLVDGAWRKQNQLDNLDRNRRRRNPAVIAKEIRIRFAEHFITATGEVPWQYKSALYED